MAYLVDLKITCDAPYCSSRAVVELRDWINETRGRYCRAHGKKALREREKLEKANPSHRR